MRNDQVLTREIAERPEGYQGPNLSPVGLKLGAHRFTDGVYALMANIPPKTTTVSSPGGRPRWWWMPVSRRTSRRRSRNWPGS